MQSALAGKNVALGVTGSIACYKALDLASKLVQAGANVETILSYGATQFVTPLAFRSLTHRPVVTDTFDPNSEQSVEHVALARWADIVVIAPATVHCIAKLAAGLADDPLTTTVIATEAPLLVAPAMDANMYDHPATRENVARLRTRGVFFAGPAPGRLASGLMGMGRLVEPADLLGHIAAALGTHGDLAGRKVIVSAGGTQEPIDPVRVITNHSSGRMGYALAEAARDRGAEVVLIAAPTALPDPPLVRVAPVRSAREMCDAVLAETPSADALIMAAAVADYRPAVAAEQKIKKTAADEMSIDLEKTTDTPRHRHRRFRPRRLLRRERKPRSQRRRQGPPQVPRPHRRQRHHRGGQRLRRRHQPRRPHRPRAPGGTLAPPHQVRGRPSHPGPRRRAAPGLRV